MQEVTGSSPVGSTNLSGCVAYQPPMMFSHLALTVVALLQGIDEPLPKRRTPVVRAVERSIPAVVSLSTKAEVQRFTLFGVQRVPVTGGGSGVVIHPQGLVLTNTHVVTDATEITLGIGAGKDKKTYRAQVLSVDHQYDVALLQIQSEESFPHITMGTSDDLMLGETVLAIGNPFDQPNTVSMGIISAIGRDVTVRDPQTGTKELTGLIQTDAPINPGSSGGPVVNIRGELIGISVATNLGGDGIGYAVPVDRVITLLQDRLLDVDYAGSVWLGMDVKEQDGTVVATAVDPLGPAFRAGLRTGDVITGVGDRAVTDLMGYAGQVMARRPGETVALMIATRRNAVEITAGSLADRLFCTRLGVAGAYDPPTRRRRYGVYRVTGICGDGPADTIGIEVGDEIHSIGIVADPFRRRTNPRRFESLADLAAILKAPVEGDEVEILVRRDSGDLQGEITFR